MRYTLPTIRYHLERVPLARLLLNVAHVTNTSGASDLDVYLSDYQTGSVLFGKQAAAGTKTVRFYLPLAQIGLKYTIGCMPDSEQALVAIPASGQTIEGSPNMTVGPGEIFTFIAVPGGRWIQCKGVV